MPNSWWEEGFCKDCPACVPCHDYGQHCRLNPRSITFEDEDRDFFPTIWHPESDWCIAGRRLMKEIRHELACRELSDKFRGQEEQNHDA